MAVKLARIDYPPLSLASATRTVVPGTVSVVRIKRAAYQGGATELAESVSVESYPYCTDTPQSALSLVTSVPNEPTDNCSVRITTGIFCFPRHPAVPAHRSSRRSHFVLFDLNKSCCEHIENPNKYKKFHWPEMLSLSRHVSRVIPRNLRISSRRIPLFSLRPATCYYPISMAASISSVAPLKFSAPIAAAGLREYDPEIKDMASYVHNYKIDSDLAVSSIPCCIKQGPKFTNCILAAQLDTARYVFLDTIGCGLEALRFKECTKLLGPIVEGTVVPNGTRVPGTPFVLDPVNGAFNIGAMIRWLDYNDCWLAAEWGHPSDNLGGILAVADWASRTNRAGGKLGTGKVIKIKEVLEAMVKAHEIQGCLALENSFNKVGLDHVVLVKVATAAVISRMMGLSERQTADAISQAWVDGQSLRTYRHTPNTMSRKSWAAGDACQRAVNLVLKVQNGEQGIPTVLSAPVWGFYDVLFKGKKFEFQRPYGSYVMENVLFKVSYPGTHFIPI